MNKSNFETHQTVQGDIVFVKDASLYFTIRGRERRRREIVITSAKHKAERSELLQVRAPYTKLNSKP